MITLKWCDNHNEHGGDNNDKIIYEIDTLEIVQLRHLFSPLALIKLDSIVWPSHCSTPTPNQHKREMMEMFWNNGV